MPITVEQEKKGMGLMVIIGVVTALLVLGGVTYALFFAQAPLIEVITSPELENLSQISLIELDSSEITESPVYQVLEQKISLPVQGFFGRENPFRHFISQ